MYVKDKMTLNPQCISIDTTVSEALDIFNENDFHRLPVIDKNGKILGLITEGVIMESTPSKATSLSIYELNYLLSKQTVDSVMIKKVITISCDELLEEAALRMRTNDIGCLPVVEDNKVIGIITDKDILDSFIDLLGYNVSGSRYVVNISDDAVGVVQDLAGCFSKNGVNITNISVYHTTRGIEVVIITNKRDVEVMKDALAKHGYNVTYAQVRN